MKRAQFETRASHAQSPCVVAEQEIERRPRPIGFSGYGEAKNVTERDGCPYIHRTNGVFEKAVDAHLIVNHAHDVTPVVTVKPSE